MSTRRLTVTPATEAHAAQLAEHLRPEDAAEMMAGYGLSPAEGVRLALQQSTTVRAMLHDGQVVAIGGVAELGGTASVWLLAAKLVTRLPLAFMRTVREELPRLFPDGCAALVNMVWTKNRQALRLVSALGFEVFRPIPFGVSGLPFHPIRFRR